MDFGEDPPEEVEVVVSLEQRALERAYDLAKVQATDDEIEATLHLSERLTMERAKALVVEHAERLQLGRLQGRAELREHTFSMAKGLTGGTMSSVQQAALALLGAQHLGYTREGVDTKVRKAVEKAEREAAKRKGSG